MHEYLKTTRVRIPEMDGITYQTHYEHIRFLDSYHNRAEIDQICKVHGIECPSSMSKRKLIKMIILKLGDNALDPDKLYTPNDKTAGSK